MPGLPKIALARLKADTGAPKSASSAGKPGALQGADHPDANLFAAFVERTLTEKERTQVLDHLAECAECRDVAALAMPEEVGAAESTRVAAARRSSAWPLLRWGAMAAVLGALAVVVVLHPALWKGHSEISKGTPSAVPAGNIASIPPTVSAPPLAPAPLETTPPKAQGVAKKSRGNMAARKESPGKGPSAAERVQPPPAQARQQKTFMASARAPAAFRAQGVPAAKAAPPMSAPAASRMMAQAPVNTMQATPMSAEPAAGGIRTPAALWSVTPNGQVQRSTDEGKTFVEVHAAPGIKFMAVAALGNDVWAGGAGGALFHSTDGGTTWHRVEINMEGSAPTEAITGIQLHDPQHLTITTASGSAWASEDGGRQWQKP